MPDGSPIQVQLQLAPKLQCLLEPKTYKVLYGGRGAGRSWGIAQALLVKALQQPLRVLCARELQNSLSESVYQLLKDQIDRLGLYEFYDIQHDKIIGTNGSLFVFAGIKNNYRKIKSFEGIDIAWVEEANNVSKASWQTLIPTIRKPGSEVWLSFNPELETDYTYQNFVVDADPSDTLVCHMTWRDNPWFPTKLAMDMEKERKRDYDSYLNIWEGKCIQVLEGTVYAKEMRAAEAEGRICNVPYHRESPVDTFWDLGRADNTAIWFAQRVAMQYRILAYYEATGEDIWHFLRELQRRGYVYGRHYLPHDAEAERLGSKRTIEQIVRAKYPGDQTKVLEKTGLINGINAARILLPNCWFDEQNCKGGLKALRNYKFKIVNGQRSNLPMHDWASDGADAFRYMALAMQGPRAESKVLERLEVSRKARIAASIEALGSSIGNSWMGN